MLPVFGEIFIFWILHFSNFFFFRVVLIELFMRQKSFTVCQLLHHDNHGIILRVNQAKKHRYQPNNNATGNSGLVIASLGQVAKDRNNNETVTVEIRFSHCLP